MDAQRLSLISTLPPTIIETILCLVPIKEAVRTSILSREWRYTWTKIPKLVFNEDMLKKPVYQMAKEPATAYARKQMRKRCKVLFYAIFQVLLLHQGPISEFTLSMNADYTCVEIGQIILHLSRKNTLRKLCLRCSYMLPVSVNLLHQLTDLYLQSCNLEDGQTFTGLASLTSLYIDHVSISRKGLLNILSKCPLLKNFTMITENNSSPINVLELFECLYVIEQLSIFIWNIQCFVQGAVPQELPTSFVNLKYLRLEGMCFLDKDGLSHLFLLIRSSLNLEKLKIQIYCDDVFHYIEGELDPRTLQDYSDIWLAHLLELEIENNGSYFKAEMEFMKIILAKSPVLKKINIVDDSWVGKDEEMKKLKNLLRSPRASSLVDINFKCFKSTKHC